MDITSWGYSLSEIQGLFSRKQQRVVLADVSRRNKTGCVVGWSIEILRRRPLGQLKWVFPSCFITIQLHLACEVQMILDAKIHGRSFFQTGNAKANNRSVTTSLDQSTQKKKKKDTNLSEGVWGCLFVFEFDKFHISPTKKCNKS